MYKIKGWRDGEVVFHAGAMDAIGVCNVAKVAMEDGTSNMVEVWELGQRGIGTPSNRKVLAYIKVRGNWRIVSPETLAQAPDE